MLSHTALHGAAVKTKNIMKNTILGILSVTLAGAALTLGPIATAAETVVSTTSTTNTIGEISEFSPDTIVVRTESAPEPIRYSYTKTTTYVDETGAPVSMDLVKSGLPVTVYYAKEGDRMIANKVVVRRKKTTTTGGGAAVIEKKTTTTGAPAVIEKKTSTTTTTESK